MGRTVRVNTAQIQRKFEAAKEEVEEAKTLVLGEFATYLLERSPVDTGTYIESHRISDVWGEVSSGVNSSVDASGRKLPKKDYNSAANDASQTLSNDIQSLPEGWSTAYIGNIALHADEVEYTHGYGVYASLRAAAPTLKKEAINKVRSKG